MQEMSLFAVGWLRKCTLSLSMNVKNGGGMVELGRRWAGICLTGDEAWWVNGLGEAGLIPHGVTQSCTSS
jgi:hypothetical protein